MKTIIAALLLALCGGLTPHAGAEWALLVMPHYGVELVDTSDPAKWVKATPDEIFTAHGITFNLDYMDPNGVGFNDATLGGARRNRLKDVLAYVAKTLNTPGVLDIRVNASEFDGSGPLAFGGSYYPPAPGFNDAASFVRLTTGTVLFPGSPDIVLTVDFGYEWHLGEDIPPWNKVDFFSVLLHEMTHGLGFTSLAAATGASQTIPGVYTRFDSFIGRRVPAYFLFSGVPPVLSGAVADLTSGALGFAGTAATEYYGQGVMPPVYAPNPFSPGSSLQHWDTGNIAGGAVMEHLFSYGKANRRYADVDIGALVDLGYTNAALSWCSLQSVVITQPTSAISTPLGQQATIALRSMVQFDLSEDCLDTAVRMTYYVNAQKVGESLDQAAGFPVSIQRGAGTYNFTAEAEALESGETMSAVMQFTVTELSPANLEVTPSPAAGLQFPEVAVGGAASASVTVRNTGEMPASVTASLGAGPFAFTDGTKIKTFSLNEGAEQTLQVRFSPNRKALENSTLTITGDPAGAIVVALQGNGIKASALSCGAGDASRGAGDALVAAFMLIALIAAARRTDAVGQ